MARTHEWPGLTNGPGSRNPRAILWSNPRSPTRELSGRDTFRDSEGEPSRRGTRHHLSACASSAERPFTGGRLCHCWLEHTVRVGFRLIGCRRDYSGENGAQPVNSR